MQQAIQLQQSNGQSVEASLCTMERRHLKDFDTIWKDMLIVLTQEDAFWDWARKKRLSVNDERYEAYTVEYDNLTQGLLWLETQWHRSQRSPGRPLVYVEALASAPWNRRRINPDPWLKGIGTVLLQFARQRSLELGYEGRVGLHALPGSTWFYEVRGMMDLGYDSDREMVYFEYGSLTQQRLEDENDI